MILEKRGVNLHLCVQHLLLEWIVVFVRVTRVQGKINRWIRILYREVTLFQLFRCRLHSSLEPSRGTICSSKGVVEWITEVTGNAQNLLNVLLLTAVEAPEISGQSCVVAGRTRQSKLSDRPTKTSESILVLSVIFTERI